MCGRFSQAHSAEAIAETFNLNAIPNWQPRYNVAPTQTVPAIIQNKDEREFKEFRWGLIPAWAKDASIGAKLINARAETIAEKPSFRTAFQRRRCLIVADGFYEWKTQSGKKQPFYFRLKDGKLFAFAGLWERWIAPTGNTLETCTIITTIANEVVAAVHDRMPAIFSPEQYDRWLDPEFKQTEELQALLHAYPAEAMATYPVGRAVNSPSHDGQDCIQAIA
jgi:putative SOS response-associated peptidase YedK